MSSLVKKTIQGNQYYYIVDSKRVGGKPTHVNQVYLGPVKEVLERLKEGAGATGPVSSAVLEFGAVAALYDLAERLGVVPLMDELSGKRRQGLSVGTYLLLAALNRALAPTSKKGLADWHAKTILSRWMPCGKQQLSSQRFWDHMKYWTDEAMEAFERRFTAQLVERCRLPTQCVVYDATNFITYIDTRNPKADVAQRGHSKERRGDLRIVGLSLLVSSEEEIPLFYEVYEGNRPDAKQFSAVVERLRERYAQVFGQEADVTLVFDRGNNSQGNLDLLAQEARPFHYVGGLRQDQCREVLSVPKSRYEALDGEEFGGATAYRTEMALLGRRLTVVATHNPELLEGQRQGVLIAREKCRQALVAQQERIRRWETGEWRGGNAPTRESCEKNVADILKGQYMNPLFRIAWSDAGRYPTFDFEMPEEALAELEESTLGKTVLYTDQHGWSNERIVRAYRAAWRVERVFRQMKSSDHLSVRPMWHWTDPMIRVHVFCCVLAYRLCCLLRRELKEKGVDMSLDRLLDVLGEKRQLVHYYPRKRGLKETYSLSDASEESDRLVELLDLKRYQLG
jgi:transposase